MRQLFLRPRQQLVLAAERVERAGPLLKALPKQPRKERRLLKMVAVSHLAQFLHVGRLQKARKVAQPVKRLSLPTSQSAVVP